MTPPPARWATTSTPPGPFTVVVTGAPGGGDVVLASGWTDDVAELLPVVHRSLRPTWVEQAGDLPVLDAVAAFAAIFDPRRYPQAPEFLLLPKESPESNALGEGLRLAGAPDVIAYIAALQQRTAS